MSARTLDEVVEYGAIVYACDGIAVTWNGSATFNVWAGGESGWTNTDCFTRYHVDTTWQAWTAATEYLADDDC